MTMTTQKKRELKELQNELIELMLTKAGVKKKDIYSVALTNWVNKNLDLLSPLEMNRYKSIIL
jgi:hypothetical protein